MLKKTDQTDVQECFDKITQLLVEYNCKIEFDREVEAVIIIDNDTSRFELVTPQP